MRLCRGDDETHNEECKDNKLSNLIESKTASCGNKVKYLPKMQSFYGVYVPTDSRVDNKDCHVYTDRSEALRFLKQHKRARFKAFSSKMDALYFTKFGCTLPSDPNKIAVQKTIQSTQAHQEKTLFKAPKAQELVKFRKAIEIGDLELVKKYVDENPRYLISNGDTPSILQEGPRYNALHVAARCNAAEVAAYILQIIFSSELTVRSYGTQEKTHDSEERTKVLLDLYLNTPDKSSGETPLHFASKAGSVSVVRVLLSYPECNQNVKNKYGLAPIDIVCSRAASCLMQNKNAIIALLNEKFYVPVLRSPDNTVQPVVGEPISLADFKDTSILGESPLSHRMEVQALAGPMSEEKALSFRKEWRTSPRSSGSNARPSLFDSAKGLERIGRTLASVNGVQWTEYWEFLDAFVNLDSIEGLNMLETFLKNKIESMIKITTALPDGNVTSNHAPNRPALDHSCPEDLLIKNEDLSPISELCVQFAKLDTSDGSPITEENEPLGVAFICFEKFLEMIAKRITKAFLNYQQLSQEVSKLQLFIASCGSDEQFDIIDLTKAHSYLSELIEKNFRSSKDPSDLKSKIMSSLNMIDETEDNPDIKKATRCILNFMLLRLSSANNNSNESNKKWLRSIPCDCRLLRDSKRPSPRNKYAAKRKLFGEEAKFRKEVVAEAELLEAEDSSLDGTEGDTESDEEYFPARSSIGSTASSDDEFSDLPNQSYDVFLAGNNPTKLDDAVLQAIASVNITCNQYPFIYYWKNSCTERSQILSKDRWPSPCLKMSCTPSSKRYARELLSPAWHR
ncbi:ankyrin repeat and LEM domain-containing protein 2 isoform X2 [Rhodnius prolixus]